MTQLNVIIHVAAIGKEIEELKNLDKIHVRTGTKGKNIKENQPPISNHQSTPDH